jgi:hypothetical protein
LIDHNNLRVELVYVLTGSTIRATRRSLVSVSTRPMVPALWGIGGPADEINLQAAASPLSPVPAPLLWVIFLSSDG